MTSDRLKSGWTRVALGDVVRQVKDRVDPVAAHLRRYVAGDHMDTDELRIRRWGTVGDGYLGPAFHMRFRPGHVLYGSRRTYLRKVAVADFEGVTANTTFVLETRDLDALLPELLPFIMQTESFHEHSIGKSRGSVNPYVNFSDIAAYEFALPPLDEQRRLARVAGALQSARDRYRISVEALNRLKDAVVHSTIPTLSAYPIARLADFSSVSYGLTINPDRRVTETKKVPYLRVANVLRGAVDLTEVKMANGLDGDERYRLRKGDVLIVEGHANLLEIGRASVWADQLPGVLHQNHVIRARCDESAVPDYVCMLINSPHGRTYFRSRARSSSGLNTINSTLVKNYSLPLPPRSVQRSALNRLRSLDAAAGHLLARWKTLDGVSRLVLRSLDT